MNIAQHLTGTELDKLYATAQFYIFPVPFCDFANSLFLAKGDGDTPISVHRRCRASSISLVCCHKKYFIFFRMESSFICCHKKIKKIFTVLWVVNIFCIFAGTGWISSSTSPQKDFEKDYLGSEVGFGLSDIWKFVFSDTCEREY